MINMKEKQAALCIGNGWVQNCEERSRRLVDKNSRTLIDFSVFTKEATKRGSSIARRIPTYILLYIRAPQGHTGGNLIASALMGHDAIPYKWKDFLFHRECSFDVTSIAGGRESKEGRQIILFTLLIPFGDYPDE